MADQLVRLAFLRSNLHVLDVKVAQIGVFDALKGL